MKALRAMLAEAVGATVVAGMAVALLLTLVVVLTVTTFTRPDDVSIMQRKLARTQAALVKARERAKPPLGANEWAALMGRTPGGQLNATVELFDGARADCLLLEVPYGAYALKLCHFGTKTTGGPGA